ncbi:MAG TPA: hypothetical protein DCR63_04405 [Microbacterium sp.]|nr:hypothetical protein [Microbacterium sp.]
MRASSWTLIAVTGVAALTIGLGTAKVIELDNAAAERESRVLALETRITDAGASVAALRAAIDEEDAEASTLAEATTARMSFVEAIGALRTALESATDKVDVASQRQAALDAQATVAADPATPATYVGATAAVQRATSEVDAKIRAYEAEQRRKAAEAAARSHSAPITRGGGSAPGGSTGGGWLAEMRSILTNVGGGGYALVEYDGNCGGVTAPACASSTGTIMVSSAVADWPYVTKVWGMTHELAHQYQFRVWKQMTASPSYQTLFNNNPELLANCMAATRGATQASGGCGPAQLGWAAGIWQGIVAG